MCIQKIIFVYKVHVAEGIIFCTRVFLALVAANVLHQLRSPTGLLSGSAGLPELEVLCDPKPAVDAEAS